MRLSYDYNDLLAGLKDEIAEGNLDFSDTVAVVRKDQKDADGYRPIINWYHDEERFDAMEHEEADYSADILDGVTPYKRSQPQRETLTVRSFIRELEKYNKPR